MDNREKIYPNFTYIAIAWVIPLILGIIYTGLGELIEKVTQNRIIFLIVDFLFLVVFSFIWYNLGRLGKKYGIKGFSAIWVVHIFLLIFALFSIASVMTMPHSPKIIRLVAAYSYYYTIALNFISFAPLYQIGIVLGNYYQFIQLAPVIACMYLWAIYYLGYLNKKGEQNDNGRKIRKN